MESEQLTSDEISIWTSLSSGLTYKEISEKLNIPLNSVQSRLKNIYRKLGVRNRAEAAIKFVTEQKQKEV